MEVILIERVHRLGDLGDRVKVKPGYARNYLIPSRKAVSATAASLAKFETARGELIKSQELALAEARSLAKALENLSVIRARAGIRGKLGRSVCWTSRRSNGSGGGNGKETYPVTARACARNGHARDTVHLHPDVDVAVKVVIAVEDEGTS